MMTIDKRIRIDENKTMRKLEIVVDKKMLTGVKRGSSVMKPIPVKNADINIGINTEMVTNFLVSMVVYRKQYLIVM